MNSNFNFDEFWKKTNVLVCVRSVGAIFFSGLITSGIKMTGSKEKIKDTTCETSPECNPQRILQAVSILRQLNDKFYEKSKKKPLLDEVSEQSLYLQVTLKKIPSQKLQKFIKVSLPTSLVNESTEVCLITGDLDKHNKKAEVDSDVLHYKELLKKQGITQIAEVITLRQLRTEYKPFEARRQLAGAYDVFLCDKKIAGVLPRTLGKSFFDKRKFPLQINMKVQNLHNQINNALSSTMFHLTCKGNSCTSEVAALFMDDKDILANITASIDILKEQLPGQLNNIMGMYIKTAKSKALPIYMSFDDPNEVRVKAKRKRIKVKSEELSTLPDTTVRVYHDGRVLLKNVKKTLPNKEALNLVCDEDTQNDRPPIITPKRNKRKSLSKEETENVKKSLSEETENLVKKTLSKVEMVNDQPVTITPKRKKRKSEVSN